MRWFRHLLRRPGRRDLREMFRVKASKQSQDKLERLHLPDRQGKPLDAPRLAEEEKVWASDYVVVPATQNPIRGS